MKHRDHNYRTCEGMTATNSSQSPKSGPVETRPTGLVATTLATQCGHTNVVCSIGRESAGLLTGQPFCHHNVARLGVVEFKA